jgi:hypothetical protein
MTGNTKYASVISVAYFNAATEMEVLGEVERAAEYYKKGWTVAVKGLREDHPVIGSLRQGMMMSTTQLGKTLPPTGRPPRLVSTPRTAVPPDRLFPSLDNTRTTPNRVRTSLSHSETAQRHNPSSRRILRS